MGQLLSIILIAAFGVLILSILILQFFPAKWTVSEQYNVRALRPIVFQQLNLVTDWPNWHVWMENSKHQHISEQESGLGARLQWESPELKGELTIVQSDPETEIQVHFIMDPTFELQLVLNLETQADQSTMVNWKLISKSDALNPLRKLQIAALKSTFGDQMRASLTQFAKRIETV
ncbi:MAG: hypothetical protein AAF598_16535 [Bacteroidota bacterium]